MREAYTMGGIRENRLPAGMLESVRVLNRRFLDLAAGAPGAAGAAAGAPAGQWRPDAHLGLPDGVPAQIAPLTRAQKIAAANCPYALFDLRFRDDAHWWNRFGDEGRWGVADAAAAPESTLDFVRTALFFAWHVAATGGLAGQWLLGMTEGTVAAFRAATIDALPPLAATEAVNLTARWGGCPAYWGALAGAAARPNPAGLRKVQLYGLQLVAAARLI